MRDRIHFVPAEAQSFDSSPDTLPEIQGKQRFLEILKAKQALEIVDGQMIFSPEAIGRILRRDPANPNKKLAFDFDAVVAELRQLKGYRKSDTQDPRFKTGQLPPREVLAIPASTADLARDYPATAQEAVVNLWELEPTIQWGRKVKLNSGEETNVAELFIAEELGRLKSRRNPKGSLEILDPTQGKHRKFSASMFDKITGKRPGITEAGGRTALFSQPLLFAEKYLPNLLRLGIFSKEDFRTISGSRTTELVNPHERQLSPKVPFTHLGSDVSIRYYLGRGKIVGTDTVIDENTKVRMLDKNTAGIVQERHGKKTLLHTISLLSPEEINRKRQEVKAEFLSKGIELNESEITQRVRTTAEETKDRVADYDITKYVPKRPDETPEQYAKRVADLSDADFVTRKFQGFFTEAGIGVHDLPWSEQLMLANAIREEKDKSRLVGFAKKFGIDGVRTLLSSDYDQRMVLDVLVIAEKLEDAKEIFESYARLLDLAKEVSRIMYGSELKREFDLQNSESFTSQFSEAVIRRSKDILVAAAEIGRTGNAEAKAYGKTIRLSKEEISRALEDYTEVLEQLKSVLLPDKAGKKHEAALESQYLDQSPRIYNFRITDRSSDRSSYLSMHLREYGTALPNQQFEYDGEARINLLFSSQPISAFISDVSRQYALSLRLDREGKTRENGEIIANDPTKQDGEASLEIGSFQDTVGRVVTVGNALDTKRKGKQSSQYYHNRESFSHSFGQAEMFARLVRFIEKKIQENYFGKTQVKADAA